MAPKKHAPTWFVIVCAERTGSNLLVSMLRSHPAIGACGEVFNGRHLDDPIPWPPAWERKNLIELRRANKAALLDQLAEIAISMSLSAFGFKLMYFQAERNPEVVSYLQSTANLRVLHLRRRNRLRRYLSHELASTQDKWKNPKLAAGEVRPPAATAKLHLDFATCVRDFVQHMSLEKRTIDTFRDKPILELYYEELASNPQDVGRRTLEFLGLPDHPLQLGEAKSGAESLDAAVKNLPELRAQFQEWLNYFDQ